MINTPINILFLHSMVNISGGERSLINLWNNLDKRKYSVFLMVPSDGLFVREARKHQIEVQYLNVPQITPRNIFLILNVIWTLCKYCRKKNIHIIHSFSPRNNLISAIVGRLLRIPVIWHERNLVFGDERDISRRLFSLPNRIICNSQAVAERFKYNAHNSSKVDVVLNGVDLDKFKPSNVIGSLKQKLHIDHRQVVGLISNLGKRKMPELFIQACPIILESSPDTGFLVVGGEFGDEDKGRLEILKDMVKDLKIDDHVTFTGFLSEVAGIIGCFDIGVAVTEKEACSRAILEMMACGKPVVAFKTGGNPELIEDGATGTLVELGDIRGLAAAVVALLKDEEKRRRMGLQARERVERFFDVRINAEKTQEIYSELLGR